MNENELPTIRGDFSSILNQLSRLYCAICLLAAISMSGCTTATADGIISGIGNPVKEMKLDKQKEAIKNDKDINIKGVNYHSFRIDNLLKSNASCYLLIPYDNPRPRWDTYCWITDNVDDGIEIATQEIPWKAYVNGTTITVGDANSQGTKCFAHVKLNG